MSGRGSFADTHDVQRYPSCIQGVRSDHLSHHEAGYSTVLLEHHFHFSNYGYFHENKLHLDATEIQQN